MDVPNLLVKMDIFVKETDFQKAKLVLNNICKLKNFELIPHIPGGGGERPKLDIKINDREVLSVVPAYLRSNIIEFKFGKVTDQYPYQILEKTEQQII